MVPSEHPASVDSIEGQDVVEHNVIHQSIEDQAPGGDAGALDVDSVIQHLNEYDDVDSAYGGDDTRSYTTSLTSSVLSYQYENGRTYHNFRSGAYIMPNDEREQDRIDLVHHIFKLTVGGEIYRSPLVNPQRVIDLGAGTGIWAIDFADQHEAAEVTGIDLSPIQPGMVPPNCRFIIDDIESEWPYSEDEKFDFIHLRTMCGSISQWDKLLKQSYEHLKPGGWIEFQEYEAWMKSDDDSMERATAVTEWQTLIDQASSKFGKRMNSAAEIASRLERAGFTNIKDEPYKVPCGPWTADPSKKILGEYMLANMLAAVEAVALALFTRELGKSYEECQVLFAKVRAEFKNPKLHMYALYRYIYGQKPVENKTRSIDEPPLS